MIIKKNQISKKQQQNKEIFIQKKTLKKICESSLHTGNRVESKNKGNTKVKKNYDNYFINICILAMLVN